MSTPIKFISSVPVLASLDIEQSAEFFASKLGFDKVHVVQGEYGIVSCGPVEIHFWACTDRRIAEATGCRVQVQSIEALHAQCESQAIVHPNAPLASKPWGTKEFAILDPDGNLVTFYEDTTTRKTAETRGRHFPNGTTACCCSNFKTTNDP